MSIAQQVRGAVVLMRLSNLPTVWTNLLVGITIGLIAAKQAGETVRLPAASLGRLWVVLDEGFMLLVGVSMIYAGGMVMNDVVDVAIDRAERPSRPLPAGTISKRAAIIWMALLLVLGLASLTVYNQPAVPMFGLMLIAAVTGYNLLHKRFASAVWLMGLCRALVIMTAGALLASPWRIWLTYVGPTALAVMVYTVLLTVVARSETRKRLDGRRWLSLAIPVVVALTAGGYAIAGSQTHVPAALLAGSTAALCLAYAAWLVLRAAPAPMAAVLAWLAGFCIIDALYLAVLGEPAMAAAAMLCFAITLIAHRLLPGT